MLPNETPIESWKEIGAYLQRDATTARRWEREEGLPVHRHSHKSRSSVYAYSSEIDAWRVSRKAAPEPAPARSLWRVPAFAATILACLVMVGNGIRPASAEQQRGALAKRLICETGCGDNEANLSPDGRWMVMTDWDTGDLAVRNISTGKVRRMMIKTETFKESSAYGESPVFSPDMRQIVYLWEAAKDGPAQLRVMPNEPGGKPRVLVDNPENDYYEPAAWSPDGKSVLVQVEKRDETRQLAWVSAADGAVKPITSLGWRIRGGRMRPSLSPDGKYIAYAALAVNPKSAKAEPESKEVHIFVVGADGSGGAELVKTAGVNDNPSWTSDGKHVLFTSDRAGALGLWSIAVQQGKPMGQPLLVSQEMDIHAMGMRSGSFYYTQRGTAVDYIDIAEMQAGAAQRPSGGGNGLNGLVGIRPTWSPDGKSIAFKRRHPRSADAYDLVIHSLESGDERIYPTTLGSLGQGPATWFHDGSAVVVGIAQGGVGKFYRLDLRTGVFQEIPDTDSSGKSSVSPDDQTLYFVRRDPKDARVPNALIAADLRSGQQRTLITMPESGAAVFTLSPDGRTFAIVKDDATGKLRHIARVGADGSGYRELYTLPLRDVGSLAVWTKDGRGMLFNQSRNNRWQIMRIAAEGGTPEFTGLEVPDRLQGLELSPDGSRLAFSTSKSVSGLWALDNIAAAVK